MRIPCCPAFVTSKFPFPEFTPLEGSAIDAGDVEIKCSLLIEGEVKAPSFLTGFALLILLFLILFSGEAGGDEFRLTPSLNLKEEYNDNLFFSEKDRKKDFITTLSPGIELINKTEKLDSNLLARLNGLMYADNNELNTVDQNYRGSLRYSPRPKLRLSADAGFTKDSTPDRDLEATGLVTKMIRRYRYNFGGTLEYTFTEKTKANLSYSYEQYDYAEEPEFVDTRAHGANIGFIHDLSKYISNTVGRMNLGYSHYEFLDSIIDYYSTMIGMNRAISEKWDLILDAGVSYTHSEFEVERLEFVPPFFFRIVKDKEKEKGVGWVGQATLSYRGEKTTKGEKTTGDLTFSHRVMPAAGTVGVTERTALILDLVHRFTYELSGRLSTGYYINKAEAGKFSTQGMDQTAFRVNPAIRYEFTKDIALEASYNFSIVKDKQWDTEAKRNLFMIYFVIQYPLFE